MARWLVLVLMVAASPARAQEESGVVSDDALIRWAANEVRILEGRAPEGERVPIPPASYLGMSGENAEPAVFFDRTPLRLLAEIGAGLLGFGVGAGLGTLIVWGAIEAEANDEWMTVAAGTGTVLGALGVTSGVVLAADATGGRGNFGYAFIGQAIGSIAAIPFVVVGIEHDALALSVVAAGILPLAGAIIAYELAHVDASMGAPQQVAFLSPTRDGVVGGVAGLIP